MAGSPGSPDSPLIRALLEEPHRFSFFQAVRLLERAHRDAVPVGGAGPAAGEVLRFRPEILLAFPPASISAIERVGKGTPGRIQLTATFLGLYGSESPLPTHWSEDLLQEQADDTTVRDFLDLFHHRIYSLFYRGWAKYRYHVQYRDDGSDVFSQRALALIGFALPEVRRATSLPAVRLLRYAGLLVQQPRSAAGLEALLSDWFGVPAEITSCTGRWVSIPRDRRNRLGLSRTTLGEDLTLGERYYDRSGAYRATLGPVGFDAYLRFLPGGPGHEDVRELTRLYGTDPLEATLEVRLRGAEVPPLQLAADSPPRLGWTTWLTSGPSPEVKTVFAMGEAA